jgi:hypothetical protein
MEKTIWEQVQEIVRADVERLQAEIDEAVRDE